MFWTFSRVGFLPAMREAGSPPGTRMKMMKTSTLTAKRTAIIPMKRRRMKASISGHRRCRWGPPSMLDPHFGTRVERVPQAVTEDVQGKHRQHDRDSRHEREPRRAHDLLLAGRDQVAPGRIRKTHSGAEEREPGLGKDVARDDQREEDEHGRGD